MWILLALTAAFATAFREAVMKSAMRDGDEAAVPLVIALVASLALLPFVIAAGADIRPGFWSALLVSGGINAAVAMMMARAVHISELSLVSPLQAVTPVFMILTGAIVLRETPGPVGVTGILVIVAGAYVLNVRERGGRIPDPLRALAHDAGARLFLGIALLFSISGAVDKAGVLASAPLTWAAALNGFVAVLLLVVLGLRGTLGRITAVVYRAPRRLGAAGLLAACGLAAQMAALPLTLAAYVIAVKRTSVLFSVLFGAVVFRERALLPRLLGATIMLAGLIILTLANAR